MAGVDGARGYRTPNGPFRPECLARKWYSRKYDWSPMPYSIFFDVGYAMHGSYEISHLGRPASHGCIRLHPEHAAILFHLVEEHMRDTRIVVTGERPEPEAREPVRRRHHYRQRHRRRDFDEVFGGDFGWRRAARRLRRAGRVNAAQNRR